MILPVGKNIVYIPTFSRSASTSASTSASSTPISDIPAFVGIPFGLIFIGLGFAIVKFYWEEEGYRSIIATLIAIPLAFMCIFLGLGLILMLFCDKCGG